MRRKEERILPTTGVPYTQACDEMNEDSMFELLRSQMRLREVDLGQTK